MANIVQLYPSIENGALELLVVIAGMAVDEPHEQKSVKTAPWRKIARVPGDPGLGHHFSQRFEQNGEFCSPNDCNSQQVPRK